jgi:3-deoxy-D-manno-octulosonic-acid transferase
MLRFFYNVGFTLAFLITWPWFARRMFRRGRFWPGFRERFSCYPDDLVARLRRLDRPVWIHAVSVGEMMLARVLVRDLRSQRPQLDVVITCTTSTARMLGERELSDPKTLILYSPVDLLPMVRKAFSAIRPSLILLIEQELWPNQLWEAEKRKIPVWIINARLSERSWQRFKKYRHWLAPLLARISLISLQSERDRPRLEDAGFPIHALFATGSMKYDVADLAKADHGVAEALRNELCWSVDEAVFLAGSTHPGEEELLLECYQCLKKEYPQLKFVLAPRHAERGVQLLSMIRDRGGKACLRSQVLPGMDVVIVDTTGELRSLYEMATVVFIGKTLQAPEGKGGQNFLEATRVGVPVLLGSKVENFQTLVEEHLEAGALICVADVQELQVELRRLLADPILRQSYGQKAKALFEVNLGVGAKVAGMVESYLKTLD